jgi:phosphoribosylformylglycinamidine synthase subunit PurQ / glutaminase
MSGRIVSVLYAIGTNCEVESMEIMRRAGGKPKLVFLDDIVKGRVKITDCDFFFIPGGFSYGDHIDAGRIVMLFLKDFFPYLVEAKIPISGNCNGTQVLVPTGLFGKVAMDQNDSGVFCSHPFVEHRIQESNCLATKGMEGKTIVYPAAHRYGKFVGDFSECNVIMTYEDFSPNGGKIAGICSKDGRNFVIMDHPERNLDNPDCVQLYRNVLKAA